MMKDVEIVITRDTRGASSTRFGMPLIVGVAGVKEYTEVTSLAEVVTAGHAATTAVYKMAQVLFGQNPGTGRIAVVGLANATNMAAKLTELVQLKNDWYFLLCTERGGPEAKELSKWAAGAGKMYFGAPAIADVGAMVLLAGDPDLKYSSTVLMYHDAPDVNYIDAAWVGACGATHPGSITWKFKTLEGIAPVGLTSGEVEQLHGVNVNTYVRKMGIDQTSEGLTVGGDYIDVTRGVNWIEQRIAERIQTLLSGSPKIPYDNRGIALVIAELQAVMQEGVAQEVIGRDANGNGMWTVTAPNKQDIASDVVKSRILPDVKFNLTMAGAIHSVKVNGMIQI